MKIIFCWRLCSFRWCESTCRLAHLAYRAFFCEWRLAVVWREDGWMGGSDRQMNEEGIEWWGRGRWRLRHITFPQCIKGTGLSVTHTVRIGGVMGGGGDGEGSKREREKEREKGRGRRRQRGRGWGRGKRKGGVWSFFVLPYVFFPFFSIAPSLISDVIQVTYSSQGGSLPPLPLPLLSFYLCLPSSHPPRSADWLNAWMNRPLSFYCGGGRGWHRKPWSRRRAGEEERVMSDKEEGGRGGRVPMASEQIHTDCWSHPLRVKLLLLSICVCVQAYAPMCVMYEWTLFHSLRNPCAHSLPLSYADSSYLCTVTDIRF